MPRIKLGNTEIYYETVGEGEPLLFIHGIGSDNRDWENQTGKFSDRYQVVAPDLRGFGQSDKPSGPVSIPVLAEDIAALVTALDMGPTHVVGLSLGGFVASQLAVDHGELVRSLVIVNSVPELPTDTFADRMRTRRDLLMRRWIARLFGMPRLGRIVCKKLFPHPEQSHMRSAFLERWAESDTQVYLDTLAAVARWSVRERLSSIQCPTLVISGQNDFFPMKLKNEYITRIRNAELVVIPGSGHLTPIDRPDEFNSALRIFLDAGR